MTTVCFGNGEMAEVTDVDGRETKTFHIPPSSFKIFDDALVGHDTLQFIPDKEVYVLTEVRLDSYGTAVLQKSQD